MVEQTNINTYCPTNQYRINISYKKMLNSTSFEKDNYGLSGTYYRVAKHSKHEKF